MGVSCSSPGAVATARAEPRLPAGAVLESCSSQARYTADRRLGAGSFGQVWLCREEKSGAPRAVKLLPADRAQCVAKEVVQCRRATEAAGEHHVPRFHEACEARVLGHPQVRLLLIAMEFIDGIDAGKLAAAGPLQEGCTKAILSDIAVAAARLHQLGVIHRDIKGENVLVAKSGCSYLCDFGLSALEEELRGDASCCGTPFFMAPEILGKTPQYSEKSDVWAYGITAMELATGRPPLQDRHAKNANRVMGQIAMRPVPKVPQDIGYSEHFAAVVQSCLARDPAARPPLRELLQGKYLRPQGGAGHETLRRWLASRSGGSH